MDFKNCLFRARYVGEFGRPQNIVHENVQLGVVELGTICDCCGSFFFDTIKRFPLPSTVSTKGVLVSAQKLANPPVEFVEQEIKLGNEIVYLYLKRPPSQT